MAIKKRKVQSKREIEYLNTDIPTLQEVIEQGNTSNRAVEITGIDSLNLNTIGLKLAFQADQNSSGALYNIGLDGKIVTLKFSSNGTINTNVINREIASLSASTFGVLVQFFDKSDTSDDSGEIVMKAYGAIEVFAGNTPQSVVTLSQLAPVAISGSYNDLTEKPVIPNPYTYNSDYNY